MGLRRGQESSSRPPSGNQSTPTGKAFKRQLHSMALVLWQELGHICLHLVISLGCFASHIKVCGELCAREYCCCRFPQLHRPLGNTLKMKSPSTELPLIQHTNKMKASARLLEMFPLYYSICITGVGWRQNQSWQKVMRGRFRSPMYTFVIM